VALDGLYDLAIGAPPSARPQRPSRVRRARRAQISELTGLPFRSHPNKFAALSAHEKSSSPRSIKNSCSLALQNRCDIRWLASGPRCGLGEHQLDCRRKRCGLIAQELARATMVAGCKVLGDYLAGIIDSDPARLSEE